MSYCVACGEPVTISNGATLTWPPNEVCRRCWLLELKDAGMAIPEELIELNELDTCL